MILRASGDRGFYFAKAPDFGSSFLSGFAGGLVGSAGTALKWGGVGTVSSAMLMGGVSSELSGGEFWRGAAVGGIVAGANHVAHKVGASAEEKVQQKRQRKNGGCPNCGLADYLRNSPFFGYGPGATANPFYKAEAIFSDVGVAPEMGGGVELGRIDFSGDISTFSSLYLEGFRHKVWLGFGAQVLGGGIGVSWSYIDGAGYIIGTSIQIGAGLSTPITGGYNQGNVELKRKNR